MKKNLVAPTTKGELTKGGAAVHPADLALEAVLKGKLARSKRPAGPPRVIVSVDCTNSVGEYLPERRLTIETARAIIHPVFEKLGPGGLAQFVYFRGTDECKASRWFSEPETMARTMAQVEHRGGWTQHGRVFDYVINAAEQYPIDELVVFTDAYAQRNRRRPNGEDLEKARAQAAQLRALGVNLSVAYKGSIRGGCPLDRAGPDAEKALASIAKANGGSCFLFDPRKAAAAAKLGEIAAHAALKVKGDVAGAQAMLEHLQSIPFDIGAVTIDDVVPTRKCGEGE